MDEINDIVYVSDARKMLRERMDVGVVCPCCDQIVKCYRIKLNHSMIKCLAEAYRIHQKGFFHIKAMKEQSAEFNKHLDGGNFAKMAHWRLILEQQKIDVYKDARTSGVWRVTDLGEAFLYRQASVRKYVYLHNKQMLDRPCDEFIYVDEAYDTQFSYSELMLPAR